MLNLLHHVLCTGSRQSVMFVNVSSGNKSVLTQKTCEMSKGANILNQFLNQNFPTAPFFPRRVVVGWLKVYFKLLQGAAQVLDLFFLHRIIFNWLIISLSSFVDSLFSLSFSILCLLFSLWALLFII